MGHLFSDKIIINLNLVKSICLYIVMNIEWEKLTFISQRLSAIVKLEVPTIIKR